MIRREATVCALVLVAVVMANGAQVSGAAPAPACAVATGAYQPHLSEVALALERAGARQRRDGYPELPLLRVGIANPQLQPAPVPCILLKAIAYLESSWHQAPWTVPGGTVGPTLVSRTCGYGVMQVTWGMRWPGELPLAVQYRIASDYQFNIAWGTRMLADRWNATPGLLPPVGDRNPAVVENWYYAAWAYNKWTPANNPNNPDLPWPRPPFDGTQSRTNYPYQELVWGLAAHPPRPRGAPLWEPVPLTLPRREDVGLTPGPLPMPDPAHAAACTPPPLSPYTIALPWLTQGRR